MESGSPPPDRPESMPAGPQAPTGAQAPPAGWEQPIARPHGWEGQPLASWGVRFGAWIIDWLILLIPAGILFFVIVAGTIGITGDDDDSSWWAVVGVIILYIVVMAIVWCLYAPLLMMREGRHNGQTWGKQLLGIRVVRNTGQRMGFAWAALREVVIKGLVIGIASSIIPLIPWLLDYLWPLWDDENRALHDFAAQTHVVRV